MTLSVLSDVLLLDSSPKPLLMLLLLFSLVGRPTDADRYIRAWPLIAGDGGAVTLTGVVGCLSSSEVLTGTCRHCSTSGLSQLVVAGADNLGDVGGGEALQDVRADWQGTVAETEGCGILNGFDNDAAFIELSAVNLRFTGPASDDSVQPRTASAGLPGVAERRLSTICGNFRPLDGDITSLSSLSTSCPALALLRRAISPRPALPSCSVVVVSVVATELLALPSFVVVDAEPFCRLPPPADASADVADCLAVARLMDPGVDGAGMDDDDGLADFALELLPLPAAAETTLPLRLSGWTLELTRRARPDRRALATPPPVVELLAMLLILVDDSVRLGTDDDDDRLPSYKTPTSLPAPGG